MFASGFFGDHFYHFLLALIFFSSMSWYSHLVWLLTNTWHSGFSSSLLSESMCCVLQAWFKTDQATLFVFPSPVNSQNQCLRIMSIASLEEFSCAAACQRHQCLDILFPAVTEHVSCAFTGGEMNLSLNHPKPVSTFIHCCLSVLSQQNIFVVLTHTPCRFYFFFFFPFSSHVVF